MESYKDFRQYILDMNKRHCKTISRLGGNGDAVYDHLDDEKPEEVWLCVYSDPTPSDEDDDDMVYDTLDKVKEETWPRRRSNPTTAQFLSPRDARSNRPPPRVDYSYNQFNSHPHYHSSPPPPPLPGPDYSYHQSYSPCRRLIPNSPGVAHPTYTTITRHRGPPKPAFYNYGVTPTYQYASTSARPPYPSPH